MLLKLIADSGYYIGLGIEGVIAFIAGVFLVLLLGNVFTKGLDDDLPDDEEIIRKKEEKEAAKRAKAEEKARAQEEAKARAEAERAKAEQEKAKAEQEKAKADAERAKADAERAKAEEAMRAAEAAKTETKEQEPVKVEVAATESGAESNNQPFVINIYNTGANGETTSATVEAPKEEGKEEEKKEKHDGVKFTEVTKTIEELYEELTAEQKSFFDELKSKALAKPQAKLSVTKTYESVKVGKSSILKLMIKKGVTIAEFLLISDALKEYKKNAESKVGKSKIKVNPTVVAVTDKFALKTALDMIDMAHEQMMED